MDLDRRRRDVRRSRPDRNAHAERRRDRRAALFAPAGTLGLGEEAIFTIGAVAGIVAPFQATGTAGTITTSSADFAHNVGASLGLKDTTLIGALGDFSELYWSRYTGPVPATLEDLNTVGNWSAPALVGPRSAANTETVLASGPKGIFLGYEVDAGGGQANFVASGFTGSGWTSPAVIATQAAHPDLYQDPGGNLRAVWKDTAGLRYRFTTATGWSAPVTLDATAGESYAFPKVAANASGVGWAVYQGTPGVQAVPLRQPAATPATYTGPTRVVTGVGYGATYRLAVPKGCVAPGQRFRVTLRWKRQRRKGNLFVKVRRTDFYLGSNRLRVDLRPPFVHTYRVVVTQPPASTITVRARAFIKVKRGKSPKKSLRVKVGVCR